MERRAQWLPKEFSMSDANQKIERKQYPQQLKDEAAPLARIIQRSYRATGPCVI